MEDNDGDPETMIPLSSKESVTVAVVFFFHLGGQGNKEAKRLGFFFQGAWPDGRGVLIGFAVCLQGKVAGGNGGNEV